MGRHTRVGVLSESTPQGSLSGTTAQRPSLSADTKGVTFFNVDVNQLEIWNGSFWFVVGELPNVTVSSSQSIASNHAYWINTTSAAITLTLPSSARIGDKIKLYDAFGTFATNACTVAPNGQPIMRLNDTMVINTQGAAIALTFYDSTRGWLLEAI